MDRPDDELARKIVQQLDRGVERLNPATRERLAAARKVALSHYRERPETLWDLAWANISQSMGGALTAPAISLPLPRWSSADRCCARRQHDAE